MTTLHIRIETTQDFDDRVSEKLRKIDEGQIADLEGEPVLSLQDESALASILSGHNLELLRTTARNEPSSMRELARLVGRDIKNVSQAVNELAELGLIELETEGRSKRPRVPYDELEVTYPLREGESAAPA